jgi:hypothetical protein
MTGTSKEWASRAAAHRDAIERLRELCTAMPTSAQTVERLAAWLESQVKRCERRIAAIRPGRKGPDQLTLLMRRPPRPAGRPRGDGEKDRDIHGRVEQWLKTQRGSSPSRAEAFAAVAKQLTNRRKGEAPSASAIKAAFYRHERRSKTADK